MKTLNRCLLLVAVAVFTPSSFSQTAATCPRVWIGGPSADLAANESLVFTARLSGQNPTARPEFRWEVSAGNIVSGQGTPSVTIDTTGLDGITVTAKVIVDGIATNCPTEASRSVNILPLGFACGRPFDTYGDISFEDEKARLDNFAIQLLNEKTATGYIIAYAGKRSYYGEAAERLQRTKNYLVKKREISIERIITIDGGFNEDLTVTLFVVPQGANPPVAMPTLSPAEVELTKPRPKSPAQRMGTIPR